MKKSKEKMKTLDLTVNGHTLHGEKVIGAWFFVCPDWPEIDDEYYGSAETGPVIEAFMAHALAGAITVIEKMKGGV